jgi:hypothetical protein
MQFRWNYREWAQQFTFLRRLQQQIQRGYGIVVDVVG